MRVKKTSGMRVVRSLVVAILALVVLAAPRYPCTRTVAACNGIAWKPSGGIVVEQRTRAFRARGNNSIVFGEPNGPQHELDARRETRRRLERPSMDNLTAARGLITPLPLTTSLARLRPVSGR